MPGHHIRCDSRRHMAFPAWAPPAGEQQAGGDSHGLLKPGWENQRSASGDTASSFLQGIKNQFGSMVPQAGGGGGAPAGGGGSADWQQQLQQIQKQQVAQSQPRYLAAQSAPQLDTQHPSLVASAQAMPRQAEHPQFIPYPYTANSTPAQGAPGIDNMLLTEDEFQANSAIEYGSGISLTGCTLDRHLSDGDPMPQLDTLSASVTLRITPTAIVFLHHYDRNFILEVPVSELYEITEESESQVVLLHTRSGNGTALLELQCPSSRKRLGIYKTLCIRKNSLERLKRQQQAITKAYHEGQ